MSNAYVVGTDGASTPMKSVRCKNESRELQELLEKNPALLAGEQMNPEDPRRWLLVKREMPVPDPSSGDDRWSIDLFLVDQSGVPTFVECKRYADTRSRREVVGQMLDYAANGPFYWTKDRLREFAEDTAARSGEDLAAALDRLRPDEQLTVDAFFERVENNLREGQIRLVFFLEEAPQELKSVVDFLNKQMERSEVFLVEAKQYTHDGFRIVVPSLFGFTEQARLVKKTVTVASAAGKIWNAEAFFLDIERRLPSEQVDLVRLFHADCLELGYLQRWGKGSSVGSCSLCPPRFPKRAAVRIYSNGNLEVSFGALGDEDGVTAYRERVANWIRTSGLHLPDDWEVRYPSYPASEWLPHWKSLVDALREPPSPT